MAGAMISRLVGVKGIFRRYGACGENTMQTWLSHVVDATGRWVAKELCLRPDCHQRGGGLGRFRLNCVICR